MGCTVTTVDGGHTTSKSRPANMDDVNVRIFAREARAAFEIDEAEKPECPEDGVIVKVSRNLCSKIMHDVRVTYSSGFLYTCRRRAQGCVTVICTRGRVESKSPMTLLFQWKLWLLTLNGRQCWVS